MSTSFEDLRQRSLAVTRAGVGTHVRDEHEGQLRGNFVLDDGVTWEMLHRLLHRLAKWRDIPGGHTA